MKIDKTLLFILLVDGLIWLRSGWGKVSGGKFIDDLPKTLERFSSQNPYPWYKQFLGGVSTNSGLVGTLIMYGELVGSILLLIGAVSGLLKIQSRLLLILMIVALVSLSLMNLNFYLASGWTSPSADSLNLLMFSVQILAAIKILNLLRR